MKSNLENKPLTYVNTSNQDNRDDASSLRNHKSSDDEQPGGTKSTNSEGSLPRSRRSEDLKLNRYKCHECTKTFSRPSSLRVHILSHTGEKPHICPQPGCGRRFSVQSNMRRHLKVHYCNDSSHPYQTFAIGKLDTHSSSV